MNTYRVEASVTLYVDANSPEEAEQYIDERLMQVAMDWTIDSVNE